MKRENALLIIAGPSAVGKTTIAYSLIERDSRYEFVRSVTTRASRGDAYDSEYIYITIPEFRELIENGGVLEHTEYAGNLYGTPRSEVERILREGKIPLLVLDINGVGSLVKNAGDLSPCGVYVYDELSIIEKRLYDRFIGMSPTADGEKKYESRKRQNISDFLGIVDTAPRFFAFIHNKGTVEETSLAVEAAFKDFTLGRAREDARIAEIAASLKSSIK
ncbi:MAG: hypothetical protein J6Q85_04800 [Clostridia bacterium]|nr:hypothetical protein [Clostridia bacterium]